MIKKDEDEDIILALAAHARAIKQQQNERENGGINFQTSEAVRATYIALNAARRATYKKSEDENNVGHPRRCL